MSTHRECLTTVYVYGDSDEDVITDHTASQPCVAAPEHGSWQKGADAKQLVADKSTAVADKSTAVADKSTAVADKSTAVTDKSTALTDESTAMPDKCTAAISLTNISTSITDKTTNPPDKTSQADEPICPANKSTSLGDISTGPNKKVTSLVEKTCKSVDEAIGGPFESGMNSPTEKTSKKFINIFSPSKRTTSPTKNSGSPTNNSASPGDKTNIAAKKRVGSFSQTIASITEKFASCTDKTTSGMENKMTALTDSSASVADKSSLSSSSANFSTENIPASEKAENTLEDSISSSEDSDSINTDAFLNRKSRRNTSNRSKSFPSCEKTDLCTNKKKGFKPFENFKWAKSTPNITIDRVVPVTEDASLQSADLNTESKSSTTLRKSSSFRRTNSIRADLSELSDKSLLREPGIVPDDICKIVKKEHTLNQVKRQGEIYEIIQTERAHCIAIANFVEMCYSKIGQVLLKEEPDLPSHMEFILEYHYGFLEKLRNVQQDGVYIERIGDVIGEHLNGSSVDRVIHAYTIISQCCKFAMTAMPPPTQSCLQSVPLRLTKYQTQLEAVNKHSKDEESLEQTLIFQALTRVKEVLTKINANIDAMEKKQRLSILQNKLDSKSYLILKGIKFGKMDLTDNRRLIHEENVKVRFSGIKVVPAILLILNDVLIFLQETMSGKYQFLASDRIRKVDPLDAYIIREKAGTDDTLFIISSKKKGNIIEVTSASPRLRNTLVGILRKTIKAYTEKRQKHFQEEREISVNYAEETFEAFEVSANACLAANMSLTSDYNDREDIFKSRLKSKHLLTASLKNSRNVMNSFSNELACVNTQEDSVNEHIGVVFPKIIGYLDLAIKLNEALTTDSTSGSRLESNFSIGDKMEELRLQQKIVENEKKMTEQLFSEERESLTLMKAEIELNKLRQEDKEKDLKEREQRLVNRAATMDNYLGALLMKNNKIFVPAEMSPSDMMNILVEHYLKTRDNSANANESLEKMASRRRLPAKSMPNIHSERVQESTKEQSGDLVEPNSVSNAIRSSNLVLVHEADELPNSPLSPKSSASTSSVSLSPEVRDSGETTPKEGKKKSSRNKLSVILNRTIGRSKKTLAPSDATIKESEMLIKELDRSESMVNIVFGKETKIFVPENLMSANMERKSRGAKVRQTIPRRLANLCETNQ